VGTVTHFILFSLSRVFEKLDSFDIKANRAVCGSLSLSRKESEGRRQVVLGISGDAKVHFESF
jgi:hypothetical protein